MPALALAAFLALLAYPLEALGHGTRAAAAGTTVVWAVGDAADGGSASYRVAEMIKDRHLDAFLYLGDVYETGTAADFAEKYHPIYGQISRISYPTPGNHEWGNREEGYFPYWQSQWNVERMPRWYGFRLGRWKFLSLNSEADHSPGSPQRQWLRKRLRSGGNCRVAFIHRPRISSGVHGDNESLVPLFQPLRKDARFFLAGHDHNMQHLKPRGGLHSFVAGAGGRSLTSTDKTDPRLLFANDTRFGALRLALRGRQARYAFISGTGQRLYRGKLRCRTG